MNNRIKELADEAGFVEYFSESGDDCEREIKKFAELIVLDCIRACGSVQEQFFNGRIATDDFNLKNRFAEAETACDMVQTKIEMIFGVE